MNTAEYLKDCDRLQRIVKVEIFFRRLAALAAKPFNFIASQLHKHWVTVYDNQKKFRRF